MKKLLYAVLFCTFAAESSVLASRIDDSFGNINQYNEQEINKYFSSVAYKSGTDHVKYFKNKNKLILYAHPSALTDFLMALTSLVPLGLGGLMVLGAITHHLGQPEDVGVTAFFGCGAGAFGLGTAAIWYFIYKNYTMRNGFVPYFTIDSKGLKKFNQDVLKWENVDKVVSETEHYTTLEPGIGGGFYAVDNVKKFTLYLDKFGEELFRLSEDDSYLPISCSTVKVIFNHCLAYYGNRKFKLEFSL